MKKELVKENEEIIDVEEFVDEFENDEVDTEKDETLTKVLTIKDILAKKEACKERRKKQTCYIYSKFLGGNLEAHSLNKKDFDDVMSFSDTDKRNRSFIFRSIDYLRNQELLEGFERKRDSDKIVEDVFSPIERAKVIDILLELNGLAGLDDNAIMKNTIEELQGE